MPNENTAIHDLLAGLQRKPLEQDPTDDVLFAGSRHEGAPRRMARGTNSPPNLFEMPAPQAPLPSPHLAVALPAYDRQLSTARVPRANKKLFLIPIGLGVAAAVVVGVLMSGGNKQPAPAALSAKSTGSVAMAAAPSSPTPAAAAAPAPIPQPPTVTPIAAPPAAAAPEADPQAMPKDAVAPAEVVPSSTFDAKAEATVPTVGAAKDAANADASDDAKDDEPAPSHSKKKSHHTAARDQHAAKHAKRKVAVNDKLEKPEHADDPKLAGNGALSVSSGAPREVWVDGRNSKRMTPLRVLLKPGKHKVTLFDKDHGTAKTFEVDIKPNTTTKVAK